MASIAGVLKLWAKLWCGFGENEFGCLPGPVQFRSCHAKIYRLGHAA